MEYFVEQWKVSEAQARRLEKTAAAIIVNITSDKTCMTLTDKFNKAHMVYYIRQGRI